jgi:hypothetical protein
LQHLHLHLSHLADALIQSDLQIGAIELQKKQLFHKQGIKSCLIALWKYIFTELFKLDDRDTVDNFQQVAAIELQKQPLFHKQGLK